MFRNVCTRFVGAVITGSLAVGCATNYANVPPSEVAKAIEVRTSDFDAHISYIGPQVRSTTDRGLLIMQDLEMLGLAAGIDKKTGQVTNLGVWVDVYYAGDWRYYESATFRDTATVSALDVSRKVTSCSGGTCKFDEVFFIPMNIARLTRGGDLDLRLNSKSGVSNIVKIPRGYIDGFLSGLPVKLR